MNWRTVTSFALFACWLLAPSHGSVSASEKDKKKPGDAPSTLVWPLPPDQPRIRFVTAYYSVDDFKKKKGRWKSALLGPDQEQHVERLMKPYGVAAARDGRVFVTDTAARRVFVFDPQRRSVGFIGSENGAGKIVKPVGVAVDDNGTAFVADATLKRVFGYGPDGKLTIAIGHEGELQNPSGLAIDRERRRLYVADAKKHQVLCYSAADGSFIRAIGKRGVEKGEFNFPTNLTVDRNGWLYVADTLNFRIQVFDSAGTFVKSIGSQGDGPGHLNRAKGVGVDSEGHIYVADTSFNNFQIFDADGQILLFVGATGTGPGEFLLPAGLFVDDEDRIYIADQGNARVQVFQRVNASARAK